MPRTRRFSLLVRRVVLVATLVGGALASSLALADPAGANVGFTTPKGAVCVGSTFQIGAWYQSYSGGSRAYTVRVSSPSGKVVFEHHGNATTTSRMWNIRAAQVGTYKTLFSSVSPRGQFTERTVARVCRSTTTTTTTAGSGALPCTLAGFLLFLPKGFMHPRLQCEGKFAVVTGMASNGNEFHVLFEWNGTVWVSITNPISICDSGVLSTNFYTDICVWVAKGHQHPFPNG
jgi:hypothetical protein